MVSSVKTEPGSGLLECQFTMSLGIPDFDFQKVFGFSVDVVQGLWFRLPIRVDISERDRVTRRSELDGPYQGRDTSRQVLPRYKNQSCSSEKGSLKKKEWGRVEAHFDKDTYRRECSSKARCCTELGEFMVE